MIGAVVGRPSSSIRLDVESLPRMTLRDYFAGQALAGWAANNAVKGPETASSHRVMPDFARQCYEMADAMMKARETP